MAFLLGMLQTRARNSGSVDPFTRLIQAIVVPVGDAAGRGLDSNARFWSGITSSESLKRQNQEYVRRLIAAEEANEKVRVLEQRISDLRELIDLPIPAGTKRVATEILNYDYQTGRIMLGAGGNAGIKPGQAVVAAAGLVGVVQNVDPLRSQALAITSPSLKIGAMLNTEPPIAGLIRGTGTASLKMEILVSGLNLKQGTKVLTSMHSEKVPGGIRIGTILRQETVLEYGTIDLYVKPSVEIGSVREVWVLQ